MGNDRRLVYSTEHWSLDKPMQKKRNGAKKQRSQPVSVARISKPNKHGVRILLESKGRGGKTVSIIEGLPLDTSALKILLKQLKGQLGAGGAVKNNALEIQGDHRDKLLILLEKHGYQAKLAGG